MGDHSGFTTGSNNNNCANPLLSQLPQPQPQLQPQQVRQQEQLQGRLNPPEPYRMILNLDKQPVCVDRNIMEPIVLSIFFFLKICGVLLLLCLLLFFSVCFAVNCVFGLL